MKCYCDRPEICPGLGICHCGCGERTRLHEYTWRKKGWVAGQPKLFSRRGHNWPYVKKPNDPCHCGCGQIPLGRSSKFVTGHNSRVEGYCTHPRVKEVPYLPEHRGFTLGAHASECWISTYAAITTTGYVHAPNRSEEQLGHRHAYREAYGDIPKGWHVHHRCGVKTCVRPEHLEAKPPKDHARHHFSSLSEADVRAIIRSRQTTTEIQRAYGISATAVWSIRSGRRWADVVRDEWRKLGGKPAYPRTPRKAAQPSRAT